MLVDVCLQHTRCCSLHVLAGENRQRGQCEIDDRTGTSVCNCDDRWHQRYATAALRRQHAINHRCSVWRGNGGALRIAVSAFYPFPSSRTW
jgi:hypothetical protein